MVGSHRCAEGLWRHFDQTAGCQILRGEQGAFQGKSHPMAGRFQRHVRAIETQCVRFFRARQAVLGKSLRPFEQSGFGKHQVAVQQIGCCADWTVRKQFRRSEHSKGFVLNCADFITWPVRGAVAYIHVNLVPAEMQRLVGTRQVDLDIWMRSTKRFQPGHQPQQSETLCRVQAQTVQAHITGRTLGGDDQAMKQPREFFEVLLPYRRKRYAPGCTDKQLAANHGLKFRQLMTHRGRRQVQHFGGTRDVAEPGRLFKRLNCFQRWEDYRCIDIGTDGR